MKGRMVEAVLLALGLVAVALLIAMAILSQGCATGRPVPVKPTPQIEAHCNDDPPPCPGQTPCVNGRCPPPPVPPGGAP